jgi:hypothetical protein
VDGYEIRITDAAAGAVAIPAGAVIIPAGTTTIPKGAASIPAGTITIAVGTATIPEGTAAIPTGAASIPAGTITIAVGTAAIPEGTVAIPTGKATIPTGVAAIPAGTATIPTGVAVPAIIIWWWRAGGCGSPAMPLRMGTAINPGNSGGPLLDSAGRLIGINAAIYSPSGASAGIGFAIPAHSVEWAVPDLIRYGHIQRPTLGVQLAPEGLMRRMGLDGAMIYRVDRGSGAAKAGLRGLDRDVLGRWRLGDVILTIDNQPVQSSGELLLALEGKKPGQTVRVGLVRDGRKTEIQVQLGGPSEGST